MSRCLLVTASAIVLCATAHSQQQLGAKKNLGPARDAGVYHMATKTWTRSGGQTSISPDYIYRNDASSCYFGTGFENCKVVDEVMLPGPTNPAGGPQDAYLIDGFTFCYCKNGSGTVDWQFCWFDSYVPCDDVCTPLNCICQIPVVHVIAGMPGGTACWMVTIDLAGGYEICMAADGGPCAPGYQGGLGLDFAAIGLCYSTSDGGTAGPCLAGDPTWHPNGDGTCYQPGFGNACAETTATGLGAQDLFGVCDGDKAIPCGLSPGCYWFGGYVNNNGCGLCPNVPFAQFSLCLFADCTQTCTKTGPCVDSAVVIGNSDYDDVQCGGTIDLTSPSLDADVMATILADAGFSVRKFKDLTAAQIIAVIQSNKPSDPSCCYVVYYSGHGDNSSRGELVGVDCNNVSTTAFNNAVGASKGSTLAILDSCGSGAFAHQAEDANNCPGFLTATVGLECAFRNPGDLSEFTKDLVDGLNQLDADGMRTAPEADAWLDDTYDQTHTGHYYNGKLPNKALSAPGNRVFVYCDEGTNPNNVADITVVGNILSNPPITVSMENAPPNQFTYRVLH